MSSNTTDKETQDKTIIEREDKTIVESQIKKQSADDVIDNNEITIREPEDRTVIEKDKGDVESSDNSTEQREGTDPGTELSSFRTYPILEQFPATGGEADIYLIKQEDMKSILKLYRYGMDPKEDVLKKAKELSDNFPEHIIKIYEYGYDDRTTKWYEIQEYARYGSLREYIDSSYENKSLKTIVEEIVEGLKVLNEHNLLHLDLKPSNILVRSKEPLDLIFSDFGIASILDSDLSKKMTKIKGTPLYWSPESFTGVVGKEADYWSLGMVILEMLAGKHPFNGLDTKVIMYTLSTKGVGIPSDIPDEYQLLLRGLLTREPEKRWSYAEVRRWLNGERDIPVQYAYDEGVAGQYRKPYVFNEQKYYSMGELVTAFVESEESWKDAVSHVGRGYVTKWLENNDDYDNSIKIEKLREERKDNDLALLGIIYTFNKELPFIFLGKLITIENLHLYTGKTLRKENTKAEGLVSGVLVHGMLHEYYKDYLNLTGKDGGELLTIFEIIESNKTIRLKSDDQTLPDAESLHRLRDKFDVVQDKLEMHNVTSADINDGKSTASDPDTKLVIVFRLIDTLIYFNEVFNNALVKDLADFKRLFLTYSKDNKFLGKLVHGSVFVEKTDFWLDKYQNSSFIDLAVEHFKELIQDIPSNKSVKVADTLVLFIVNDYQKKLSENVFEQYWNELKPVIDNAYANKYISDIAYSEHADFLFKSLEDFVHQTTSAIDTIPRKKYADKIRTIDSDHPFVKRHKKEEELYEIKVNAMIESLEAERIQKIMDADHDIDNEIKKKKKDAYDRESKVDLEFRRFCGYACGVGAFICGRDIFGFISEIFGFISEIIGVAIGFVSGLILFPFVLMGMKIYKHYKGSKASHSICRTSDDNRRLDAMKQTIDSDLIRQKSILAENILKDIYNMTEGDLNENLNKHQKKIQENKKNINKNDSLAGELSSKKSISSDSSKGKRNKPAVIVTVIVACILAGSISYESYNSKFKGETKKQDVVQKIGYTNTTVNFRSGPGIENKVIGVLQKNTKASYMETVKSRSGNDWHKIKIENGTLKGNVGYISYMYLDLQTGTEN